MGWFGIRRSSCRSRTRLIMKYIYYYSWVLLATLYRFVDMSLSPIKNLFFKALNLNEKEKERRNEQAREGFISFPGGIIDWGAYGILLLIQYVVLGFFIVVFDVSELLLRPRWPFALLLFLVAAGSYYVIYFRSIKWLVPRIKKVGKKLYS